MNKDDLKALLEADDRFREVLEEIHYKCGLDNLEDCYAEQYGVGTADEHEQLSRLKVLLDRAESALR